MNIHRPPLCPHCLSFAHAVSIVRHWCVIQAPLTKPISNTNLREIQREIRTAPTRPACSIQSSQHKLLGGSFLASKTVSDLQGSFLSTFSFVASLVLLTFIYCLIDMKSSRILISPTFIYCLHGSECRSLSSSTWRYAPPWQQANEINGISLKALNQAIWFQTDNHHKCGSSLRRI